MSAMRLMASERLCGSLCYGVGESASWTLIVHKFTKFHRWSDRRQSMK
jgi:hypothetical protein